MRRRSPQRASSASFSATEITYSLGAPVDAAELKALYDATGWGNHPLGTFERALDEHVNERQVTGFRQDVALNEQD